MRWLTRLLRRQSVPPPVSRLPEGERVYAVGDIHGRADLLRAMKALIAADLAATPVSRAVTVLLGDYIDRGSDSKAVLDELTAGPFPTPLVALRGNHEAMLLQFLADPTASVAWLSNGGLETLRSYDIDGRGGRRPPPEHLAEALRARLPKAHLTFLKSLAFSFSAGDYFFCHAGVRPGVPLERQHEHDLLWIRDEFLSHPGRFGKVVVHGHTPVPEPEVRVNRVNIDTGAFVSGRLTCLVLEGTQRRFLTAKTRW